MYSHHNGSLHTNQTDIQLSLDLLLKNINKHFVSDDVNAAWKLRFREWLDRGGFGAVGGNSAEMDRSDHLGYEDDVGEGDELLREDDDMKSGEYDK